MDIWSLCLLCAIVLLCCGAAGCYIVSKMKKKPLVNAQTVFAAGIALASIVAFYPIYKHAFRDEGLTVLNHALLSVHNTIRLFVVDSDYSFISENLVGVEGAVGKAYNMLMTVLYIIAPAMTFGFVLSFFKNLSAYKIMLFKFRRKFFVFSELNDGSLALASNLKKANPKSLIIFTDVYEKDDEYSFELKEKADELKAICFRKDITAIHFNLHSKKSTVDLFIIGEDEDENVKQVYDLAGRYNKYSNMALYIFSSNVESGFIVNTIDRGKLKVRRIDTVRSLIQENLYENGYNCIFSKAEETDEGYKKISALVLGMGKHGTEMTKALPWFCQMDSYRAYINCFDADKNAESRFKALCPELYDEEHNGNFEKYGEAQYKLKIHPETDVLSNEFYDKLREIGTVTYILVALGDDGLNIQLATNLRSYYAAKGMYPAIQAVVYSTEKKRTFSNMSTFNNLKYDIDFIGDLDSKYSIDVVLNSDLENKCIIRHEDAKSTDDFWKYEYNYRSSIASVMHQRMKRLCKISAASKYKKDRTAEEAYQFSVIEHRRWNAYMRSEGYCCGEEKNHLAKTHPCLIDFEALTPEDREKDNYELVEDDMI